MRVIGGKFIGLHDVHMFYLPFIQSHTGEALAQAFQDMLVEHKLTYKVSKYF